jgi:hypothetical protein
VTRVRTLVTMGLITPMAAGTAILGVSAPAHASGCIGSASITSGPGSYTTGSSVHVSATMDTVKASLYVAGPGGNWDIGSAGWGGSVGGSVHPSLPGSYSITITGDITGCTFASGGFSVTSPATHTPAPGHSKSGSSHHSGSSSNSGTNTAPNGANNTAPNNGSNSNDYPNLSPQNSGTSLNLPSVAPDGTGDFQYPANGQNPQVASPAGKQRLASNEQSTSPVQWGRSIAVALVLLLLSAHLTMWNRRYRMAAAAGAARGRSPRSPKTPGAEKSSPMTKMADLGRRFGLLTNETAPSQHAAETVVSAATDDGSSAKRPIYRGRRRQKL